MSAHDDAAEVDQVEPGELDAELTDGGEVDSGVGDANAAALAAELAAIVMSADAPRGAPDPHPPRGRSWPAIRRSCRVGQGRGDRRGRGSRRGPGRPPRGGRRRRRAAPHTPAATACLTDELGYSRAPVVVFDDHDHWSGYRPDQIARVTARLAGGRSTAAVTR